MKKLNKYIMLFAAFAMALASCSKEELNTTEPEGQEVPGTIKVRFGTEAPITKAVSTTDDTNFSSSWITGKDKIGVTIYSNATPLESNVHAKWDGDAFEADFTSTYDPATTYQFKGVYPYSETDAVDFGNTRDQIYNAQSGKYDIMVSKTISATLPAKKTLILPMDRQTATVYFHLKSGFDEEVKSVTLVTDEGKPIAAISATLDTENGFVPTTGANCNFITLNIKNDESKVMHTNDMQFWFNVLPVEGTSLKLIVESENHTFTMNKKANTTTWVAGHLYTTVLEGIPANKWVEKAGASQKITITKDNSDIEGAYKDSNFTIDDITLGFTQWCISDNGNGDDIQAKKSTPNSLYNTTAFPGKITKITFNQTGTARAISVSGGNSVKPGNTISAPSTAATMVFDFSGKNYNYFTMNTPGNACYFSSIEIEYESTFDPLNPNFSITVPDAATANGTVDVEDAYSNSIEYAKAGEKLTLIAVPNEGYGLTPGTLKAKNSVTGDEIPFETGTTFTMPAANVIIAAEFYKLPYKVTYDANLPADQELGEGESVPIDESDYTDENNEVTVKSASLTCLDYNFVCWNTKADGTGTDYVVGNTFTITENTTLYAKWTDKLYTVTLEAPENGSYVIINKDEEPLNDNTYQAFSVKNGTELTYTYTADEGYKFKNWQVVDASTHTYTSSLKYIIDHSDITIKGNFEAKVYHKAYFSVEGTITNPEGTSYDEDVTITFPEAPTPSREGFIFIGWTKEAIEGTQSQTPTTVDVTTEKMGKADVTYYAVFAEGVKAVFDPNDITATPSTENLQWTHTATGITLKLSAGQLYNGSPKTFTVNNSTSNYFEISSSNVISKITATVSGTNYKIGSTSSGATLSTVGTTQIVTSMTLNTVKCYATSNNQIRLTKVEVESCKNYCTTIPAPRQLTSIAITGDVTKKTYNDGETLDPDGLVVTANYDNGDSQDVTSSTEWSYDPATLSAGTTSCTVTATYEGKTDSKTIEGLTVNAAAVYTKVTSLDELTVDSQIIIVADASNYAMSTTQNGSNRGQAGITKSDNTISNPGENVQIFTAKAGKKAKTIAFYTGSGYIYAASSSANNLKTESTLSDNSSFTLEISDGKASLKAQGTNTRNLLRYNSTSEIFSCYSSGQGDINIYKLNGSGTEEKIFADVAVTGVSLNKTETTISVNATETLTATITPADATNKNVTWTSSATGVATVSDNGVVKGIAEGTATITVKTVEGDFTATCDVTVEAGGQGGGGSYTITFATGSGDGTSASTSTACSTVVSDGSDYLSGNLATATKVYYSGGSGLKLGASSSEGTIKMNLSADGQVTPKSIVVNAKLYNSSKATTLKVNGSATQNLAADFADYTYIITSKITYIELVSSKYCWIKSVTVNY